MTEIRSPIEWAFFVNQVLDEAFGRERHPMSVIEVARMFSASKYPQEPIAAVEGDDLPGFQGALIPDPGRRRGWVIIFNSAIPSRRRIRFTLAHEFGHYLMHRALRPRGFHCVSVEDSDPEQAGDRLEREADIFAANLLMPIHDFREHIAPGEWTDLNMLSCAADRYGVSLMAAIRQWLRYTHQRAVLAVSRDGYILWSEASESAKAGRTFFPNVWKETMAIPGLSLAAKREITSYPKDGLPLPKGVWFPDHEVVEMAVHSDQYEFVISLLMLDFKA
ncbi:MAG: ImmA/IrrE family metallo-endopeptidase [Magnetococcales bacterium]|nr:ImmA/IrrE family metallo-endopeptidase [Magnetococcales bacterium]